MVSSRTVALTLGFLVAAACLAGYQLQASAAPQPLPQLSLAAIHLGDGTGAWETDPHCSVYYDLYLYDSTGTTLLNNADSTVSLPLSVGQRTIEFWGDYFPDNPVLSNFANQLRLSIDGSPALVVNDASGSPNPAWSADVTSVVVGAYTVSVSNFTLSEHPNPATNRVSPCLPQTGGGGTGPYAGWGDHSDSTGSFTVTVTATIPTTTDQCKNGAWRAMTDANGTFFKNQGDCVSYVATKGRNLGAGIR